MVLKEFLEKSRIRLNQVQISFLGSQVADYARDKDIKITKSYYCGCNVNNYPNSFFEDKKFLDFLCEQLLNIPKEAKNV